METAKVDIKKLQVLSDRINQCIDALNQVRISVHGLAPSNPFAQGGVGTPGGLSHSSPFGFGANANPYAALGGIPGAIPGTIPGTIPGLGGLGVAGFGQFGGYPSMGAGLSHTGQEGFEGFPGSTWSDPYLAARVNQTFPYLKFAVPPVVSLY